VPKKIYLLVAYKDEFLIALIFVLVSSAFDIVQQRNGYGEAQSAACRAGVCEAILYVAE
jgi:hypothetical protein